MKKFVLACIFAGILCITYNTYAYDVNDERFVNQYYLDSPIGNPNTALGSAFGVPSTTDIRPGNTLFGAVNASLSDGPGGYNFGSAFTSQTLILTNEITGWVAIAINNGVRNPPLLSGVSYTVDATASGTVDGDDPNISSVTGSKSLDPRRFLRTRPGYALFSHNRNANSRPVGSLTLIEGNYFGESDQSAARLDHLINVTINGSSFVAGNTDLESVATLQQGEVIKNFDSSDIVLTFADGIINHEGPDDGNAGNGNTLSSTWTINNQTLEGTWTRESALAQYDDLLFHDVIIGGNNSASTLQESLRQGFVVANGGNGVGLFNFAPFGSPLQSLTINGGDFFGGDSLANIRVIDGELGASFDAAAFAEGGNGVLKRSFGTVTVNGGHFAGGDSKASIDMDADDSMARAGGGQGFWIAGVQNGTANAISNVKATGGHGGSSVISGSNSDAYADGGNGILITPGFTTTITINDTIASGSFGGVAVALGDGTEAYAMGGNGVHATDINLTINGGTYTGAQGGNAHGEFALADGGSGVRVEDSTLTINGGTFNGAAAGNASGANATARTGRGVFALNSDVTINDGMINDGIYFSNSGKALNILGGTINDDIMLDGTGSSDFTVAAAATNNGLIFQNGGTVNVTLGAAAASSFFKEVLINGTMDFSSDFSSASETVFMLADNSAVEFNSLTLNDDSGIWAGYGDVRTAAGNIKLGTDSGMVFLYDGWTTNATSPMFGSASITGGSLIMTNSGAGIILAGVAATTNGSVQVVSAGSPTDFGANNPYDVIMADLGWLVKTNNIDGSAGIRVDFDYNTLSSNSALTDLGLVLLDKLDDTITSSNFVASGAFYNLNSEGQAAGEQLIRYSTTQLPDVADAAFQVQQQVSEQIAARGTEYRSMHGFASSKPTFGKSPMGAAGPEVDESDMQGWVRVYGAMAERDAESTFTDFDSTVLGTVIGVDKSFGNLLVGLAGGYARGNIDAGSTYDADIDTYHGTVYSTIGGKSTYVDLALTYGLSETDVENIVADDKFDSHTASGYIGLGRSFSVKETVSITPEASFLLSYYEQDAYDRAGILPISIKAYDEMSYLGSLGASVSSMHQLDWLNLGFAVLPEFRVHWLHEFNADLNDFTYSSAGIADQTFGVRSREEDLLKIGVGLDLWSWKRQNAKFEVDYDGLFGDDYDQHVLSGKISVQF
jgi:outer membrane autotransporter protein